VLKNTLRAGGGAHTPHTYTGVVAAMGGGSEGRWQRGSVAARRWQREAAWRWQRGRPWLRGSEIVAARPWQRDHGSEIVAARP
jgi:hypothetical protein